VGGPTQAEMDSSLTQWAGLSKRHHMRGGPGRLFPGWTPKPELSPNYVNDGSRRRNVLICRCRPRPTIAASRSSRCAVVAVCQCCLAIMAAW